MSNYSKEQENYLNAASLCQTIHEQKKKRFDELNLNALYDEDFEKAFELEEQINKGLRLQEAYTLLFEAEKALVEWVFECPEFHLLYRDRLEELEPLRDEARKNIYAREKIVKIAMNLDVESK